MPVQAPGDASVNIALNERDAFLNPAQFTKDSNGQVSFNGAASGQVVWSGVATITLGAGDNDDIAPDLTEAARLQVTTNAAGSTLTGIAAGSDGQVLVITNVSANDLTLSPEDAGSAAANRLAINGPQVLGQYQSLMFLYDATIARWTALGV